MTGWVVRAPAKLNFGLEVLRRRPDGYHELVTILQTVSLFDTLSLETAPHLSLACTDPTLDGPDNLVLRALTALRARSGVSSGAAVALAKAIPTAAGLGGASSDAAAALVAGRALWGLALRDDELVTIAAGLGSDVPFFVRGGTALATGRGEVLVPLPTPAGIWFVLVTPRVVIPRKTPILYEALATRDWSDGGAVLTQADRLRSGLPWDPSLLRNAFVRPLGILYPDLASVAAALARAGATTVALSGAGPTHYAPFTDPDAARHAARAVIAALGNAATVAVCEAVAKPPGPTPS